MPSLDWNDLKYLLALHRVGRLDDAAQKLGVNETTVARRIKRLSRDLNVSLFARGAEGRYTLVEAARPVLAQAEAMEAAALKLRDEMQETEAQLAGTVRVSAVPIIANALLVPQVASLRQSHPNLTLEVIPEARNVDLTNRDADLALRFSRPTQGGHAVRAQKIAALTFAVFASAASNTDPSELPWITYVDEFARLPQAQWSAWLRQRMKGRISPLKVNDLSTAHAAAVSGQGLAVLPRRVALADPRLRPVTLPGALPGMQRELWLLTLAAQKNRPAIAAVRTWLLEALTESPEASRA